MNFVQSSEILRGDKSSPLAQFGRNLRPPPPYDVGPDRQVQ